MNLHHIKTFYFVAKNKSIKLASKEMFIAQSAVIRHISEIQKKYNIELFEKSGKDLILTDIGEELFNYAKKIFDNESKITKSIIDYSNYKLGKIKIAASNTFGAYYLPPIISEFNTVYPDIKIEVISSEDSEITKIIETKEADIGFLSSITESELIISNKLLSDPLLLFCSKNNDINKKIIFDLSLVKNYTFIMLEKNSATRNLIESLFNVSNINPEIKYEFSHNEAVKSAVISDLGISILSEKVLENELYSKSIKGSYISNNAGNIITKDFYVIKHINKFNLHLINKFIFSAKKWAEKYSVQSKLKL
jgi:DNA-binding transcriptional LysR family regulator